MLFLILLLSNTFVHILKYTCLENIYFEYSYFLMKEKRHYVLQMIKIEFDCNITSQIFELEASVVGKNIFELLLH